MHHQRSCSYTMFIYGCCPKPNQKYRLHAATVLTLLLIYIHNAKDTNKEMPILHQLAAFEKPFWNGNKYCTSGSSNTKRA